MNFEINQSVKYNKKKFIISAFLDNNNTRSLEQLNNKWVLLYDIKTSNQIIVPINLIVAKKESENSFHNTDDILDKIFP